MFSRNAYMDFEIVYLFKAMVHIHIMMYAWINIQINNMHMYKINMKNVLKIR